MSYPVFQKKIKALIVRAGGGINVRFSRDLENGRHIADFADGTRITADETALKVCVSWGDAHVSMAAI